MRRVLKRCFKFVSFFLAAVLIWTVAIDPMIGLAMSGNSRPQILVAAHGGTSNTGVVIFVPHANDGHIWVKALQGHLPSDVWTFVVRNPDDGYDPEVIRQEVNRELNTHGITRVVFAGASQGGVQVKYMLRHPSPYEIVGVALCAAPGSNSDFEGATLKMLRLQTLPGMFVLGKVRSVGMKRDQKNWFRGEMDPDLLAEHYRAMQDMPWVALRAQAQFMLGSSPLRPSEFAYLRDINLVWLQANRAFDPMVNNDRSLGNWKGAFGRDFSLVYDMNWLPNVHAPIPESPEGFGRALQLALGRVA